MDFKILFISSEYRGDHSADTFQIFEPVDGETVDGLVKRIGLVNPVDSIQIKIVNTERKDLNS